jgi:hypothetical protein
MKKGLVERIAELANRPDFDKLSSLEQDRLCRQAGEEYLKDQEKPPTEQP